MTNREKLQLAMRAARTAGAMLKEYTDLHVDKKAKSDYVTDADRASENLIREILLGECPEDGFFGEEGGVSGEGKQGTWVVDPIDGTTNFIKNLHPYTISIAYMKGEKVVAGVVYAPLRDEMFSACESEGAFLNGKPIHASAIADPQECILGMSFAHRVPDSARRMFELIPQLLPQINDMRRLGSAAYDLCMVACGKYDAFIELSLNLYDIAAGVLIAREAGAITSGWHTEGDLLKTGHTLAAAPGIYEWLKKELAK